MSAIQLTFLDEILQLHSEIISSARTTLDKAIRIGELLTEQKALLKHGEWLPWISENLPFDRSILDACCGSRMFWFDPNDQRAVFVDNRKESHILKDSSQKAGFRTLTIDPDLQADFTALPFPDNQFALVVFDPPHLIGNGTTGWLAKKYGKLQQSWRDDLRKGFSECFRVLRPDGTLIFKWNERDIPVSQVLVLTPERPLFGNRCGKQAKSHWIVFLKSDQ